MSNMKINFVSNRQAVLDELDRKCELAMQKIGTLAVDQTVQAIEGNLGMRRAVKTGRLKNSIKSATRDTSGYSYVYFDDFAEWFDGNIPKITDTEPTVYIGTEVPYAYKVYYGFDEHYHIGAREFLKIGITTNPQQFESILKAELQK